MAQPNRTMTHDDYPAVNAAISAQQQAAAVLSQWHTADANQESQREEAIHHLLIAQTALLSVLRREQLRLKRLVDFLEDALPW